MTIATDLRGASYESHCLDRLLDDRAKQSPSSVAIVAPDRPPLTSERLQRQIKAVGGALNDVGVRRGDRVAMLLPSGPEMAVAWLGVAAHAASAPLNPAYRSSELEFYFSDLNVAALVIESQLDSPAREIANREQVPVVELTPARDAEAGLFDLHWTRTGRPAHAPSALATPDEVALVLHTSGTTSRPKIVPLRHENLCASSRNIAHALALSEADRCLDVNQLFHIHGLMVMLASVLSGGSVAFLPPAQVASSTADGKL